MPISDPTVVVYVAQDEQPFNNEISGDQTAALYIDYSAQSQYEFNGLNVQLPIALSNDPAFNTTGIQDEQSTVSTSLICSIGPNVGRRAIRVHGTRVGDLPSMPTPAAFFTDENGIDYTLLKSNLIPIAPTLTPDQQDEITVDIEYIYAMSRPPLPGETIRTGLTPWIQQTVSTATNNYSLDALLGGGTG